MTNDPKRHSKDPHYVKAKKEGYRARSAYKLLDIQKRFNIFKRAFYILDLGSAPGSWLQVAKKFAEENIEKYHDKYYSRDNYKIMGVDLKKISPIENVNLIKMDLTQNELYNEIESYYQDKLDLIISDASIKKSGNKFSDQARQIKLNLKILEISHKFLKYRGILIIKAFQGADFPTFFKSMKKYFQTTKSYKPKASKKTSNEIYLLGLKKK
jgi:23S rRNA (uridine2552-2'-O)-methyltransferase